MHTSNSLKVLSSPYKNWEKNDKGKSNNHNNYAKSSYYTNHHSNKTHWTELEITGSICNLSPSLWTFVHLTKLNIGNNNLTSISGDITSLTNLHTLDLRGNRLHSLPEQIGDMIALKELHLENNCLKNLPFEIGKLFQLKKLGLKGNPLPTKYLSMNNETSGTQKLVGFLFDHLPTNCSSLPERPWLQMHNCGSAKPAVFTVMCYNVLCEKNCSRQWYGYCPQWALKWDYRKKTIIGELRRYQADVICLQEVETDQFYNFFQSELKKDGYAGLFAPKSRARTMQDSKRKHVDGCAIFYKSNKFRIVKEHLIEFNQLAIEVADGSHDMINRVMTKDNIALAVLLQTTPALWPHGVPSSPSFQSSQPILIATCHVHWDPEYCDVKLIQTMMLMHKLNNIIIASAKELRPDLAPEKIDANCIPLVMCGDMNSKPESGVVEFMKLGRVTSNHKDFKDIGYKDCLRKLSQSDTKAVYTHNLKLSIAYNNDNLEYTNYTYDFKAVIDYILYTRTLMRCLGVLGPPDNKWFIDNHVHGCPHPQIPSDHISLFAQFELTSYPFTSLPICTYSSSSSHPPPKS